jgi:hypothetical protein
MSLMMSDLSDSIYGLIKSASIVFCLLKMCSKYGITIRNEIITNYFCLYFLEKVNIGF